MDEEFDEERVGGISLDQPDSSAASSIGISEMRAPSLADLPYYHGKLSRQEADSILAEHGPNDCFLVRKRIIASDTDQRDYQYGIALHTSGKSDDGPKKVHFRVRQRFDLYEIGGFVFNSLPELVAHYGQNEIYPGSLLQNPIAPRKRCHIHRVIATLSYTKSENTNELSFATGDVFNFQYEANDSLWVTHIKSNETGLVYKCMVEELDSPNYDPDMEACEFYHPGHRDERLEQLKSRQTGDFFLRPSASNPKISVLCVNCTGAIKKFEIEKVSVNHLFMSGLKFSSIDEIITHYSTKVPIDQLHNVYLAEPLLKRNLAPNVPADDIYSRTTSRDRQMDKQLCDTMECMLPKRRKQRSWKRHRCVLSKRGSEYEILIMPIIEGNKRANPNKPKDLIALEFAHLYPISRGTYDRPHCLQLVILHPHGSSAPPDIYVLAADSAETLDRWRSIIKPLCLCGKKCNLMHKRMKHVSTLEVTISCARNLSINCKLANVTLLFNGVAVAKTRSNRREQDDEMTINWDEHVLFDFPECVTKLGFHLQLTKLTTKVIKHDIDVNSLPLGSTADYKLASNNDRPVLCCKVRRVSHAVLPSKDYVPIRDIILQNVSPESAILPDIVQALADVCPSEDLPHLAKAVFRIFSYHNREAELLTRLLLRDIQAVSAENEGTLLRNTSVGTAALEVYLETKEPVQFVRQFLEEMVQQIVKSNINLELNSSRLAGYHGQPCEAKDLEAETLRNADRLTEMLTRCLLKLHNSATNGKCPPTLRAVSAACQLEVTRKFPQANARVLSTIFFLRLFCPALTTKFKLIFGAELHAEASTTAMRSLQIAAKALLLFANQSRTFRESYMEKLKTFVTENGDIFQQLNSYLTSPKIDPTINGDCDSPPKEQFSLTFELASLHDFCKRHQASLVELQRRANSSELKNLISATEFLSSKLEKGCECS